MCKVGEVRIVTEDEDVVVPGTEGPDHFQDIEYIHEIKSCVDLDSVFVEAYLITYYARCRNCPKRGTAEHDLRMCILLPQDGTHDGSISLTSWGKGSFQVVQLREFPAGFGVANDVQPFHVLCKDNGFMQAFEDPQVTLYVKSTIS